MIRAERTRLLLGLSALSLLIGASEPTHAPEHAEKADEHSQPKGAAKPGNHAASDAHGERLGDAAGQDEGHEVGTKDAHAAMGSAYSPGTGDPSFAARLAQTDEATASLWQGNARNSWKQAARRGADQQQVRWDTARAWLGKGRGAEALGILDVMLSAEAELDLVPQFRVARGAALAMLNRPDAALAALDHVQLVKDPEACAWRLLAAEKSGDHDRAIGLSFCAEAALSGRSRNDAAPFNLALANAYLETGKYSRAIERLAQVGDRDGEANLLRGMLLARIGKAEEAELRFERAELAGGPILKQRIRFERIALGAADHAQETLKQLDEFLFKHRGGRAEADAIDLGLKLAREQKRDALVLQLAASKLRYYPATPDASELSAEIVAIVEKGLAEDSKLPLTKAADRLWSYRDLVPSGTQGDRLLYGLTRRLEEQGLHARAAELLSFHASRLPRDVTRGPVSVRIARNWILARKPKKAFQAAARDNDIAFDENITNQRNRLQAVALYHMGQKDKAAALLESIPGGKALLSDIAWQDQDWKTYAAMAAKGGSDERSALRLAIAYAMQGDDEAAARLGKERGSAMRGSKSAALFAALTGDASKLDSQTVAEAMKSVEDIGVDPLIAATPEAAEPKKTETAARTDSKTAEDAKTLAAR